jgi:dolichyl-phosphate-mannose-protein mannosyltransferase
MRPMSVASPADSPIALKPSADTSTFSRRLDWRSLAAVELVWFGFALVFTPLALPGGDATYAFAFLRALFGEKSHVVTGYQAGLSYFETPFYGIGRALKWLGVDSIAGHPIGPAAIALGMILLGGLTIAGAAGVVKALGFQHSSLVAGAAVFGTTVFFYATFSPGQTHTVDAMTSTIVAALALGAFRRNWELRWLVAVGVVVGIAMTVRYFDGAQAAGLGAVLLLHRRIRETVVLAIATAAAFGVFLIPVALVGVPLFGGGFSPNHYVTWSPASPLKMLFTDHRGVFVWTPLVFLGCVGLVRLIRTRRAERPFYLFVAASALILLALQSTVAFWDAGWSFSNRYLTQLFPLVFVGVAGLLDWRPRLTGALGLVAVAWSVYLGLSLTTVQVFDLKHQGASDVARPVLSGQVSPGEFGYGLYAHSILLQRIAASK